MRMGDIQSLLRNEPENFMRKFEAGANSGDITLEGIRDINSLWRATAYERIDVQLPDISGQVRTITTSAFPIITGTLVIAAINARYAMIPTIGQELVTEMDDNKKVSTIVGISTLDSQKDEVKEGENFPEIGASEEKIEIRHLLNGRRLTMSADVISENELGNFALRVNDLTDLVALRIEKQTLSRVTDHNGSGSSPAEPYAYRPNGVGTALYSASANTPGTRAPSGNRVTNNGLSDETNLEAARTRLNTFRDDNGDRIGSNRSESQILVPDAKIGTLSKILNSEYVPGVVNEKSNWGPGGRFGIPMERVLSSPVVDNLSTSAWYYGAFRRQFIRKWKLRFEYVSLGMDTQAFLNARIAAQFRIAWDCEIGARDYVFVVQNLDGTTAPVDE